jgi:hypothetical protein
MNLETFSAVIETDVEPCTQHIAMDTHTLACHLHGVNTTIRTQAELVCQDIRTIR